MLFISSPDFRPDCKAICFSNACFSSSEILFSVETLMYVGKINTPETIARIRSPKSPIIARRILYYSCNFFLYSSGNKENMNIYSEKIPNKGAKLKESSSGISGTSF